MVFFVRLLGRQSNKEFCFIIGKKRHFTCNAFLFCFFMIIRDLLSKTCRKIPEFFGTRQKNKIRYFCFSRFKRQNNQEVAQF